MGDFASGHGVGDRLYLPGGSPIHRLPPHVKIVAAVATIFAIVLTPPQAIWAFAVYFLLVAAIVATSRLPVRRLLPRLVVEVPFVVFAILMPFLGTAPMVEVGPFLLSEPGLWAAWGLLAKATLGVMISIVLAATTPMTDAVAGLRRLHVPDQFISILASMIRYLGVVTEEAARMARARAARGFAGKGPRAWGTLAKSLGTLFIRSYERGERVHLAMVSRGYDGHMPQLSVPVVVSRTQWAGALALPTVAGAIAVVAVLGPWG